MIPQMIAAGDDVHAGGKDFLRGGRRDARTAGGIFPVGDDEVDTVLLPQFRHEFLDCATAGLSHDVTNEKNLHWPNSNSHGRGRKQKGILHLRFGNDSFDWRT